MIFFIVFVIVVVGICVLCEVLGDYWYDGLPGGVVLGLIAGLAVLLIGLNQFNELPDSEKRFEYGEMTELIALKDNTFLSRHGEDLKYIYFYESPRGITYGEIDADDAYIHYISAGETPRIQEWKEYSKSNFKNWLFSIERTYYTIYLPEGSVIENSYQIDLD